MKKFVLACMLLSGCAGSTGGNNGQESISKQIDEARVKMDSASKLLKNVYDIKREDSIAYALNDKDGIGSDHNWTHPDTIQSWINKDSLLYKKWAGIKDSLDAEKLKTK